MEKILSDWQSLAWLHENLFVAILAGYLAAKLPGWIPAFFRAIPRKLDAWGKNHHQIFVTQTAILAANPEAKALFALREVQYQLRAYVIFSFCILAFYLAGDIPKDAGNPTYWFFSRLLSCFLCLQAIVGVRRKTLDCSSETQLRQWRNSDHRFSFTETALPPPSLVGPFVPVPSRFIPLLSVCLSHRFTKLT